MKQFYPFIFLFFALQTTLSAVNTWTGLAGDNNWATAGNWSDGLPASGAAGEAYFSSGGTITVNFNISGSAQILGNFVISGNTHVILVNSTGANKTISLTNGTADFQLGVGSTLELQGANRITLALGGTGSVHNILGTLDQNSTDGTVTLSNTTVSGTIRASKPNVNAFTGNTNNNFTATAVYEIVADNVSISRTLGPTWSTMASIKIIGNFVTSPKFQAGTDAVVFGSLEVNATGVDISMGANNPVRFGGNVNIVDANSSFSIGNQVTINGNLDISSGEKMVVNTAAIVRGNVVNAGTIEASGTATFEMGGTSAQTIDSDNMLGNLIFKVNNGSGISTTGGLVQIPHTLELTAGIINTSTGNELAMVANKTVIGGSDASHVDGPMKKTGSDAFMFPVGDAGIYAPCGIEAGGGATDVFVAEYVRAEPVNRTSFATSGDPMQQLVILSAVEYWDLNVEVYSAPRKVTLTYRASSVVNIPAETRVSHYGGGEWSSMGNTAMASGSITSGDISTFSPFTFGGITLAALPVDLTQFSGKLANNGTVLLDWTTASEYNMKSYEIERSADGRNWNLLGDVEAAGNTQLNSKYEFVDVKPLKGLNYYRLRMLGTAGDVEFSNVIVVRVGRDYQIGLSPNPTTDLININFGNEELDARLMVYNAQGRLLVDQPVFNATESLQVVDWPSGVYQIVLIANESVYNKSFIKQ